MDQSQLESSYNEMIRGGIWALIAGDALGVPVEFKDRWQLEADPVTGMRGYGSHNQPAGTWSDDSSMMLGAMDSLCGGYDPEDIMRNFDQWLKEGKFTPHGVVFDVGNTCRKAIQTWDRYDIPAVRCGGNSEDSNGNGSLMWSLPICYYAAAQERIGRFNTEQGFSLVMEASGITHHHIVSRVGCGLYYFVIKEILDCRGSSTLFETVSSGIHHGFAFFDHDPDKYDDALIRYSRLRFTDEFSALPENKIQSTGYIVDTLEASVWCLLTTGSLEDALFKAVNLGSDTDTVGAVTGGLAGTWYGYHSVPEEWQECLARREWIAEICDRFVQTLGYNDHR